MEEILCAYGPVVAIVLSIGIAALVLFRTLKDSKFRDDVLGYYGFRNPFGFGIWRRHWKAALLLILIFYFDAIILDAMPMYRG